MGLPPNTSDMFMKERAASICRTSSADSITWAASAFSFSLENFRVPGMGTIRTFAEHPRQKFVPEWPVFFRQIMEQEEEILVGVKAFRSELRHGAAVVRPRLKRGI